VQKPKAFQYVVAVVCCVFSISATTLFAAQVVPTNITGNLEVIYRAYLASQAVQVPNQVGSETLQADAAAYLAETPQDAQGRMNVMVHAAKGVSLEALKLQLAAKGLKVTAVSSRYRDGVIEGWVRVQDVAAIARTKGVRTLALSIKPMFNVGSVTQQGVVQHRVNNVTQDGTGVSIGALSDSYNFSTAATPKAPADVLSGDLPGPGNPVNSTPVSVLDESVDSTDNDEGRAMLQLIHDIAPKSRLAFATAGASKQQFADNIRSLAALPGAPRISPDGFVANIIVDDVIFLDEPMFSDGIVAQAVNDVNAAGVHYFSSAGNQPSTQGYAGTFNFLSPAGTYSGITITNSQVQAACSGGFHNFATDGGTKAYQSLRRTGSTTGTTTSNVQMMFQWDDPFDKNIPGTLVDSQSGTFTGTPVDHFVTLTAGTPYRISVTADEGSGYDSIVTISDPSGTVILGPQDTDVDENAYIIPSVSGSYKVTLTAFNNTTGAYHVETFADSAPGMTTDYNLVFFRADTGAPISITATDNLAFNEPYEFKSSFNFGVSGASEVKMAICRKATANPQANRIRYVFFSSAIIPGSEVSPYQYPMIYGHSVARDAHGVAAFSAFRPYIPESFTSGGPATIALDGNGDRLAQAEVRQQPTIAAMDGANNTFFLNATQDSTADPDTFPNFFGTSAAAPNAAAVAALVLQARGGPGSITVQQMKQILRASTMPNDLDPYASSARIATNGGVLDITVKADSTNTSAAYPFGPLDLNVVKATYTGTGSIATINFNGRRGNMTGGNVNTIIPGLVFDTRSAALGGLPFTLGSLVGLTSGDIAASFSNQAGTPSAAGQFYNMALTFNPGSFTTGRSLSFNVDRDEQTNNALTGAGSTGGNAADHWGSGVEIPGATISRGGMVVTGTMTDGSTFSGIFVNNIGTGWSPLTGYGFLNAERAVAVAAGMATLTVNTRGNGSVTSAPEGINCPPTCAHDFAIGTPITLTSAGMLGGTAAGFSACDTSTSTSCTITSLDVPRTVIATFTGTPEAPLLLTATRGNGQATIEFLPPASDGGNVITAYTVTCGAFSASGAVSPIVVTGLTNGNEYSCSVTASNSAGTSQASSATSVTPATVPDAPVIDSVSAGNGSVTVAFHAGASNGGSPVTSFTATCGATSDSGPSSPIVVSPLPNGVSVTCTVTATNTVGTSAASAPSGSVTPHAPSGLARGDFDANGKGDLLWKHTDGRYAIWLMDGLSVTASAEIFGSGTAWQVAHIADVNGNGKSDLVWQNPDGSVVVYMMDGTTTASTLSLLGPGPWTAIQTGDFDGNGQKDIVFRNTDGTLAIYLMSGEAVSSGATILEAGSGWTVSHVGDFNGDGKADLVFTHTDGRVAVWLMNGLTPITQTQILNAGSGWSVTKVEDLNNDGKSDIVWTNTDGRIAVWLMDGTTMSSGGEILGAGTGWGVTQTGDFDGDGKADLVFTHTDGRVAIYLMDGLTPTTTTQILNAGSGWSVTRVTDLNGDGKSDIVWTHTDGRVAAWLMNGTTMSSGAEIFGAGSGWSISPAP
jgi:5-hydroxyisourate hydrolase-like protein (transthyretin family)